MLPLLYSSTNPIPSPESMEYIGRITKCIKCTVSQQINNDYQLSAVFAATEPLLLEIQNQRFILQKTNFTDPPQFFEIYNQSITENGQVTIKARHIKHCAYNNILLSDNTNGAQSDTPQGHWNFCTDPDNHLLEFANHFNLNSNINEQILMEIGYTKADTLGMFLEEMAKMTNGEYHYDNFEINLLSRLGTKKNYTLRWNKNIGSPNLTLSSATVYTHVVAYANLTASYTITGQSYEFPVQLCSDAIAVLNGSSALRKIYMYNASDSFENKIVDPTSDPNYTNARRRLRLKALDFVRSTSMENIQTREAVNLKVTFRQPLDEMKEIELGDTIDVFLKDGRTIEARVTKTEFDSLAERWTNLEIGKQQVLLSNYIAKTR